MATESRWMAAMRSGNFEHAWAINSRDLARRVAGKAPKHEGPRHLQHIWHGEDLRGRRVLVRCYHGLGDTLQFVRFAKPLRRVARHVVLWAQPELLPLLDTVEGADRKLPLHNGTPDTDFDVDIEIMELAFALRATRASLSAHVPYLSGSNGTPRARRSDLDPARVHVGLVWTIGDWAPERAISSSLLTPLASLPHVSLHCLLPASADQRAQLAASDLSSAAIEDAAATITQLDLVLTVDTMMAHLAGALGIPVWTLLCRDCDWRWGEEATTPWYPTMRLFRQRNRGDWVPVIQDVARALNAIVR